MEDIATIERTRGKELADAWRAYCTQCQLRDRIAYDKPGRDCTQSLALNNIDHHSHSCPYTDADVLPT